MVDEQAVGYQRVVKTQKQRTYYLLGIDGYGDVFSETSFLFMEIEGHYGLCIFLVEIYAVDSDLGI